MRKIRILTVCVALLAFFQGEAFGQQTEIKNVIKGRIVSTDNTPVAGAIISTSDKRFSVITDENGTFEIRVLADRGWMSVKAENYYDVAYPLSDKIIPEVITMIPQKEVDYKGMVKYPYYADRKDNKTVTSSTLENKDFSGNFSVSSLLQDEFAGVLVRQKSGMPGEGAYMNVRGIHSFVAENNPLLVINGIPYMSNTAVSDVLEAYSRDMLCGYDVNDIRSITVLKGVDAAMYGSLGSNGVVLIETAQATSDNLETRISFNGEYGYNMVNKTYPTLSSNQYKTYMQDMGMTRYGNLSELYNDYPFLQNGTNYYSYLFNNQTNWIKQVQGPAFITDNNFRVEGGDEIAKYNISFGYTSEGGLLNNTNTDRYHTLINSDIMVSRKVDIFTNLSLAYIYSDLQEQGMNTATNAMLTSYLTNPMLSPYLKEDDNSVLERYATYDFWNVSSNPMFPYANLSNALGIVNTIEGNDKIYDVNLRLGMNYKANDYLTITGLMNLYYNYTEEKIFIPGVTDKVIMPMLFGTGENMACMGVNKINSNYFELTGRYKRVFDVLHDVNLLGSVRYMTRDGELDMGYGYNSANDFYKTLGNMKDDRRIRGNNNEWKWLNYLLHGDYTYNQLLKATANISVDGTSVAGADAPCFGVFPSAGLTFMMAKTGWLPEAVDVLNLTAEASLTGNSRFSSNYAKNYYINSNLFNLGTIDRANVPNTKLQWEKKKQVDAGVEMALFGNAVGFAANVYSAKSYDLLMNRTVSAVYGTSGGYYDNSAAVSTKGYELSLRLNPVHTKDIDWVLTGTIGGYKSEITSLGKQDEALISYTSYNGDDVKVMMKVGEEPYQFYGYKTNGVYATSADAQKANLINLYGKAYQAGDVIFQDTKADGFINDKDKVCLGSATPDCFGGFGTSFRYKRVSLQADFGFSVGNKAYNAVRRSLESMDNFYNQSEAVLNRWQVEGQVTNMPRAAYGDPSGNNFFSDRWIEDASYLKLRSVSLTYHIDNLFSFIRSGSIYVTGENLWTLTDYLGSDPEFAYSYEESMQGFDYAKIALPLTVKIGVNLNF